jgi:hypothetical protein
MQKELGTLKQQSGVIVSAGYNRGGPRRLKRRNNLSMSFKRLMVMLLVFVAMPSALTAQGKNVQRLEQLHFSAEDDAVRHPIAIPADVLTILKADEMVRNALENANLQPERIPLSWFSAASIHLSNSARADLVVMARGPLAGGNVVTFWVFRSTAHGHDLVLSAPAHDLVIKNTRGKGYRDIELVSMSAVQLSTVLCRFDGEIYAKYKTESGPIR